MPAHAHCSQGRAFKIVTGLASSHASRKLNGTVVDIDLCIECCILASTSGLCFMVSVLMSPTLSARCCRLHWSCFLHMSQNTYRTECGSSRCKGPQCLEGWLDQGGICSELTRTPTKLRMACHRAVWADWTLTFDQVIYSHARRILNRAACCVTGDDLPFPSLLFSARALNFFPARSKGF